MLHSLELGAGYKNCQLTRLSFDFKAFSLDRKKKIAFCSLPHHVGFSALAYGFFQKLLLNNVMRSEERDVKLGNQFSPFLSGWCCA